MSMQATTRAVKKPDASHPIVIEPNAKRVVVSVGGRVVADTQDALTLREANYGPVLYVPRRDVDMSFFSRSEDTSYCPYKGDCSYFTVTVDGKRSKSAAWTYEAPFESVIEISEHLAFYPDRVDKIEELSVG